jgi:hypothetical protein
MGGWGNTTACPEACADVFDGSWAMMRQCVDNQWWCGSSDVSMCDSDDTTANPTLAQFFTIPNGGILAQALLPQTSINFKGCAISPDNQYSFEKQLEQAVANATKNNGNSSIPTQDAVPEDCPNGVQIGEGVAIGVLAVIALATTVWALWERRQRRRSLPLRSSGTETFENLLEKEAGDHRPQIRELGGPVPLELQS